MDTVFSQRCTHCLIPTSYPAIRFDANGVCNQCREFVKGELKGEAALLELVRSVKGTDYDCVLGISGGKGSCNVEYLSRESYSARALKLASNVMDYVFCSQTKV